MNHIAVWPLEDRRELFQESAAQLGITASISKGYEGLVVFNEENDEKSD